MGENDQKFDAMLSAFEDARENKGFTPEGFEIIRELDQGGMAAVYLAKQLQPEREVALKVVLPRYAQDLEIQERFQREGHAMAALDHPNILPIYQIGEWDGMAFFAMKLAKQGTLHQKLSEGIPSIEDAVNWMIQAGRAVHFAHQHGVLHRDIKPGNLLFDEQGTIYVGDFGVAKMDFAGDGNLTKTEAIIGTPYYLAPEVAAGKKNASSVAADLYGLGTVLYECLTGQRPHHNTENFAAQLREVIESDIIPLKNIRPDVPRDLQIICEKALAKIPSERYMSVADFVQDLGRWREGKDILARRASPLEKTGRWMRRHPLPANLAALLLITILTSSTLLFKNYKKRGELLHKALIDQARSACSIEEPGFRERALKQLQQAHAIQQSDLIRETAVTALASWDTSDQTKNWNGQDSTPSASIMPSKNGIIIKSDNPEKKDWAISGGVLRCEPEWSPNGRFLALVMGERMEVIIYDVNRKLEFAEFEIKDWPTQLHFGSNSERLKVDFSDNTATLLDIRGEVLIKSFNAEKGVLEPRGFFVWQNQHSSPTEANPYGGNVSKDETLLATTSVAGVQIWNTKSRSAVDFYMAENQRIDAETHVWWAGERALLLQVPGALEILSLDKEGNIIEVKEIARVPGTRIEEITEHGDWIVENRDEDGLKFWQRWPQGNAEEAVDLPDDEKPTRESLYEGMKKINFEEWALTLPQAQQVEEVFYLDNKKRVVVLTKSNSVCEWDLELLQSELEKLGLY